MNDTAKYQALQRLYAQLPGIGCQRKCQKACGPIALTRLELHQLLRFNPRLDVSRIKGKTEGGYSLGLLYLIVGAENGTCPFLKDGSCSVYEHRPLICRLWGSTQVLVCPFGCQPERVLSEEEAFRFAREAIRLGF
jgi:hypothetical protein